MGFGVGDGCAAAVRRHGRDTVAVDHHQGWWERGRR